MMWHVQLFIEWAGAMLAQDVVLNAVFAWLALWAAFGRSPRVIPRDIDPDSRRGFPCAADRDSPWRTEGGSPWVQRSSFARTTRRMI